MKTGYPDFATEKQGGKSDSRYQEASEGFFDDGGAEDEGYDDFIDPDLLPKKPPDRGPCAGQSGKSGSTSPGKSGYLSPGKVAAKHTAPEPPRAEATQDKESSEPPPAPVNKNHRELTTLPVALNDGIAPTAILEDLLEYLENETKACLQESKGNMVASIKDQAIHAPHSLKANIFVDVRMCAVKVQVYQQKVEGEKTVYLIEFQRCSGCTVMFNTSIFPKVCQLFAKHKNYQLLDESLVESWRSREVVEANDDTASEYTDSCCCNADMLDPILSMAGDKEKPDIQSQAACGVYDAMDPRPTIKFDGGHHEKCAKAVAEKLYEKTKGGVQENRAKIEALLDSTFEEVLYPTARALTRLTRFTEPENDAREFWFKIGTKITDTRTKMQGSSTLVTDALGIVLSKLAVGVEKQGQ